MSKQLPRRPELDPVKARTDKVIHTGSCNRVSWVGRQVVVTLRNGDEVACSHEYGHRTNSAAKDCAAVLVARLNRAAGTSTQEVEARNAQAASV